MQGRKGLAPSRGGVDQLAASPSRACGALLQDNHRLARPSALPFDFKVIDAEWNAIVDPVHIPLEHDDFSGLNGIVACKSDVVYEIRGYRLHLIGTFLYGGSVIERVEIIPTNMVIKRLNCGGVSGWEA
jgi:hypothetical protein